MGNSPNIKDVLLKFDPRFVYDNYIFYVLTKNDIKIIRNDWFNGAHVLHRNAGYLPLLWVIKPQNIAMKNIKQMENGIIYFNTSSAYLTSYKSYDKLDGTYAHYSALGEDIEEILYIKYCYTKYFVIFSCKELSKFLIIDISNSILHLYLSFICNNI